MYPNAIRVLLADVHAVVRAALKAVLSGVRDIEIVGEASSGREAVDLVERIHPDVVVMDLSMLALGDATGTREIVARCLDTRVLIVTKDAGARHLGTALTAGAAGYLVEDNAHRELATAVRVVAHGDVSIPRAVARGGHLTKT